MPEDKKRKPKPKYCARQKCRGWYRPSKYRSAGPFLEYCSVSCMKKAAKESTVVREIKRDW